MPLTPATIGRRYSPLIILAAVQLLLVTVAPSKPAKTVSSDTLSAGPVATGSQQGGPTGDAGAQPGADGSGTTAGTTGSGGGTAGTTGGGTASGGSASAASTAAGPEDRSRCGPDGKQIGPTFYMP